MKVFKIICAILGAIVFIASGTSIGLTIWANRPRGVKIDISKLHY